jgi:hypothetical protein
LQHITALPLEYLQVGEGVGGSGSVPIVAKIKTLKRLTLTMCGNLTDDELKLIATMKHLENLELGSIPIDEARMPLLRQFAHLKALRLTNPRAPFSAAMQEKITAALPGVALKFQ